MPAVPWSSVLKHHALPSGRHHTLPSGRATAREPVTTQRLTNRTGFVNRTGFASRESHSLIRFCALIIECRTPRRQERQMARFEMEAARIRRMIEAGDLRPGDRLRIADVTSDRGISTYTVRRALEVLEEEGLVRVVRGTGAVIQPPTPARRRIPRGVAIERDPTRGYVFPAAAHVGEPWEAHGRPKASLEPVPQQVADLLDVPAGSRQVRRRRITSPLGDPPFQIVDTWLSPTAVADAPQAAEPVTGPGGYLDRIEESGHGPLSWQETTTARMPSGEEARLLGISPALPVLELILVGRSGRSGRSDEAVEVTIRVIPADRVEMVTELIRAESARWPVDPVPSS